MKTSILAIALLIIRLQVFSQTEIYKAKGIGATLLPTFSIGVGKHLFSEVGLTYSPYMELGNMGNSSSAKHLRSNYYIKASAEFNYRNPFIIGPKLSFHYRYLAFFESGMSAVAYMNSGNTAYILRPETGVSFFGLCGFHYGYNIRIDGGEALSSSLNKHQFTIFVRLILK